MKRIIILGLLFSLCFIFSCTKETFNEKYASIYTNSLTNSKKIIIDYTVTDQDVKVYEYIQEIDFRESVEISEKTYTLSTSSFDLTSEETFKVEELKDKSSYLSLELKEELVKSYEEQDNLLILKVTSDNLSQVLGVDKLTTSSDEVEITIELQDKMISSVKSYFLNDSKKQTCLSYTLSY